MTSQATATATAADTWPGIPRLTLSGVDAREFLTAVDCAKHALPGPVQRATRWYLYAYHVDCGTTGGYVTTTDGYRASRWAFRLSEPGTTFYAPVAAAAVDEGRKARNGAPSLCLTPAPNITYPDVWRSMRVAMQGSARLGRVASITPILRAVNACERAGFGAIKIDCRGNDVQITAEDADAGLKALFHVAGAVEEAAGKFCINPAYLAGSLRAIARGMRRSEVVAELSPDALRITVMEGDRMMAEELIMTRRD